MFLAVVLLAGALSIEAGAALKPIYAVDENNKTTDVIDYKATVNQYLDSANVFKKDEDKLAKMTLKYEKNGYQLWADEFTGEVATVNLATGQTPTPSTLLPVTRHIPIQQDMSLCLSS